ncbi:excisionase family protein [Caballeronia sp. AZ10_KS36]|uniref:excisionase family protein n=1 Tax=Caballeronia sp. AZ10_KS36 TaxID=2921757 RepID=UPI0020298DAF|nr:excisionase family protein [Caballeronia sp. AZ10_KS36]
MGRPLEKPVANPPPGSNYVTVALAASLTGLSEKAIRRKIEQGRWLDGREYRRAPDGHIFISLTGYQRWVEQQGA